MTGARIDLHRILPGTRCGKYPAPLRIRTTGGDYLLTLVANLNVGVHRRCIVAKKRFHVDRAVLDAALGSKGVGPCGSREAGYDHHDQTNKTRSRHGLLIRKELEQAYELLYIRIIAAGAKCPDIFIQCPATNMPKKPRTQ